MATHHRAEFERVVPVNQSFDRGYYTGRFTFYFYPAGVKQKVEVDDYLPTRAGRLIYCSNRERPYEFWPCLLEKAYAKFKGSYAALYGGRMKVALGDLTGRPVEVIDIRHLTQGTDDMYSKLQDASNNRAVMAAAIHKTTDQQVEEKIGNGLYAGHVYSITGYHQLRYYGRVVNLIRLRNPWGHGEWTGAWSDSSPEMNSLNDRQLRELREKKKDDGEFWMEFNEFVKHFHEINLCYV
ncbi:calpain-8-like [Physella acuta]|uniref:calpain-8-like n=1 Tax=Physella acuta TaxID=109671 RepID=UPI0027DD8F22|nr:calpain-8-like [Physella acuta]